MGFSGNNCLILNIDNKIILNTFDELYNDILIDINEKNIDNNFYIKDISDKNIYVNNGEKWNKVLGIKKIKNNCSLFRVFLDNYFYIDVTDNHLAYIENGNTKFFKDLILNYDKQYIYSIRKLILNNNMEANIDLNKFLSKYDKYKIEDEIIIFKSKYNNMWCNIKSKINLNKNIGILIGYYFMNNIVNENVKNNEYFIISNENLNTLIYFRDILYKELLINSNIFYDNRDNKYYLITFNSLLINIVDMFIDYNEKCLCDNILNYDFNFLYGIFDGILLSINSNYNIVFYNDISDNIENNDKLKNQLIYLYLLTYNKKKYLNVWLPVIDIKEIDNNECVYELITEDSMFCLHGFLVLDGKN